MIAANSNELKSLLNKKTAVALGSFDAIHRGHIAVIGKTTEFARKHNLISVVQIFKKPPENGSAERRSINTLERRLKILDELGVDIAVIEEFTDSFKNTEYQRFVADFLVNRYNAAIVVAGDNYRFGRGAEGNSLRLCKECEGYGIKAEIIAPVELKGVISSTRIRELIVNGDVETAAELMTRPYSISGNVVHGSAVGRLMGFPTANIAIPSELVVPREGVYLSRVILNGRIFYGITNIGAKPTVGVEEKNIETYIADYKGDIYGEPLEVEFLRFLREIRKFDGLDGLKAQLEIDKQAAIKKL